MSISQLRERVDSSDEKTVVVGRAVLKNYHFFFNKKSVFQQINGQGYFLSNGKANIEISVNNSVTGVLFSLTKNQMRRLDKWEGARLNPPHYKKTRVAVEMMDRSNQGILVEATTYVATPQFTIEGYIKPAEVYLNTILEGARENGIDTHSIERAANNYR